MEGQTHFDRVVGMMESMKDHSDLMERIYRFVHWLYRIKFS